MKVLLITTHLNIGGISVYTITLANCLSRKGHKVFVASGGGQMKDGFSREVVCMDMPLRAKSILHPKLLLAIFKLFWLIRKEKIEVIHSQTRVAHFVAHVLSKITGVPYVVTWHGFYRPHFFRKFLPLWGARTIAISKTVYASIKDDFKRPEAGIRLVFNGVDEDKFVDDYSQEEKRAIKVKHGLKDGPVIGIISRLSPEKGHLCLVEAFKGVAAQIPNAQLLVIGEGRSESEIKERVRALGIGQSVCFIKETLNTKEFLAIMNVFTRPSISEGFGLAVVEAMLMGIPIVSTDVGGFRSILNQGRVGLLVEPENPAELEEALVRVLKDLSFAKQMGRAGKDYALSNFSADRMVSEIEGVYREVIDEAK